MTLIRDLIVALSAALIVSSLFALVVGVPRMRQALLIWPFLVLFLATWAGGVWLSPIGPPFFGGYVLPFFVVALAVALVIAASTPSRRRLRHAGPADNDPVERLALVGVGVFAWIAVFSLAAAIVVFYARR